MFFRKEPAEVAGFSKEPNASRGYDSPMRFSLATLLLLVLWIGAAMAVWFWREPWQLCAPPVDISPNIKPRVSPDEKRKLDKYSIIIQEYDGIEAWTDAKVLWTATPVSGYIFPVGFIDNETICRATFEDGDKEPRGFVFFRRRFPEWWWGHFYRPEVWLFAVLSGVLVWRIGKTRMKRVRR